MHGVYIFSLSLFTCSLKICSIIGEFSKSCLLVIEGRSAMGEERERGIKLYICTSLSAFICVDHYTHTHNASLEELSNYACALITTFHTCHKMTQHSKKNSDCQITSNPPLIPPQGSSSISMLLAAKPS